MYIRFEQLVVILVDIDPVPLFLRTRIINICQAFTLSKSAVANVCDGFRDGNILQTQQPTKATTSIVSRPFGSVKDFIPTQL